MPLREAEVVEILNSRLQKKGGEVLTLPYQEFYKLSQIERLKQSREKEIAKIGRGEYTLIIAFGQNVVLVAHDRNFSAG